MRLCNISQKLTLCDKNCQWLATGRWFSQGTLISSTNKTDCHEVTEILLKMALSTINQPTRKVKQPIIRWIMEDDKHLRNMHTFGICVHLSCQKTIPHYVIQFVSDLRQVSGFLRVLRFPPPIKLTSTI